jgi:hypothetical protein
MTAAQQADERDRQLVSLREQIEALLPGPVNHQQRCFLDNALVLNLNGVTAT